MTTFFVGYAVVCLGIVGFVARMARRQSMLEQSVAELQERHARAASMGSVGFTREESSEVYERRAA